MRIEESNIIRLCHPELVEGDLVFIINLIIYVETQYIASLLRYKGDMKL